MPLPIEEVKEKGTPTAVGGVGKKIDLDQLASMLQEQAYTISELADTFGAKPNTVRMKIRALRQKGFKVMKNAVNGVIYYYIEE